MLLGGGALLTAHGASICQLFTSLWGDMGERGMLVTLPVADMLLAAAPGEAAQLLLQPLAKLLALLLGAIRTNFE